MKEFKGKVAVVTGAASGIGRGLAEHCVQKGMKVTLADIEETPLRETEQSLRDRGAEVLAVSTDVSRLSDIEALAEKTVTAYGGVDLLFNNAGVAVSTGSDLAWESTTADWQWIIGVNLLGVIHGTRVFIPIMLHQDSDCHVVNTASIAGLNTTPNASYAMTKHGIVGFTEALYLQLREANTRIGVSLLCPGLIRTRITESARNRPVELRNGMDDVPRTTEQQAMYEQFLNMMDTAMTPEQYAPIVFDAIVANRFYVLSEDKFYENIRQRNDIIMAGGNPELAKHYP